MSTFGAINSASSFSIQALLFTHFADANNSGTSATDLYSDTLAAGKLATNGDVLNIQYGGTFTGAISSSQRLRAYFGGTLFFDTGGLSIGVATDSWDLKITIIRESSTAVRCSVSLITNFAALSSTATYTNITGLTLSNTQVVKITGTAAGAGGASNQITSSQGFILYTSAA